MNIQVHGIDDPTIPNDYSFSPPHQPWWDVEVQCGQPLMTALMDTMHWVEMELNPALVTVYNADGTVQLVFEYTDAGWRIATDEFQD